MKVSPWPLLVALSAAASAQAPSTSGNAGYVVRVESSTVYLDLTEKSGARAGAAFVIYKEGEPLKHPVTGADLGRPETKVAEGVVGELYTSYSVGRLAAGAGEIKPGMRARLAGEAPPASTPQTEPKKSENAGRRPRWTSPMLPYEVAAMAPGSFSAGAPQLALADQREVYLYSYPPSGEPLARFRLPGTDLRVLSLEAADLDGDGKDALFVSVNNEAMGRVETAVLELGDDGRWSKTAEFPWLVRGRQDFRGARLLEAQQLTADKSFPFSTAYALEFKDGRYSASGAPVRERRAEWLYGFTFVNLDGSGPTLLTLTQNDRLRLEFKKGHWRSDDGYGQTPVRLSWAGRILEAHPRLVPLHSEKGLDALFALRNEASLGGLAGPFGRFKSGSLDRLEWNGLALVKAWSAPLSGYATALSAAPPSAKARELAVAVVGTSGKSSVWIYDP